MNHESLTLTKTDDLLNIYKESGTDEGVYYQALTRPFNMPL
jgi:hypothetical protein